MLIKIYKWDILPIKVNGKLHPEVESAIREGARKYLIKVLSDKEDFTKIRRAAESGKISFDDIYFLGALATVGAISLEDLADLSGYSDKLDKAHAEMKIEDRLIYDLKVLKNNLEGRVYKLMSLLYNCSEEQIFERNQRIVHEVLNFREVLH